MTNTERVVALIPARLDSTRLPRKQLRLIDEQPMIDYLSARMQAVPEIDEVILATTDREVDIPLVEWAENVGIRCYRGSLEDVLGRLTGAAQTEDADIVVRANGDNPLLSPEVTSIGIQAIQNQGHEYVTGKNRFTGLPIGIGPGIIKTETLSRLENLSTDSYLREHVTPYLFENPGEFNWAPIPVQETWIQRNLSLTVDTKREFEFVDSVIKNLPDNPPETWTVEEIIRTAEELLDD